MARTRVDEDEGGTHRMPSGSLMANSAMKPAKASMKKSTAVAKAPVRARGTAGAPGIQKKTPARPPGLAKAPRAPVEAPAPPRTIPVPKGPTPMPILPEPANPLSAKRRRY